MMSPDQILDMANRAYHDNRMDDCRAWWSLLQVIGYQPDGCGGIVLVTQRVQEARERIAARAGGRGEFDDLQFDYEREAERQGVTLTELMR